MLKGALAYLLLKPNHPDQIVTLVDMNVANFIPTRVFSHY